MPNYIQEKNGSVRIQTPYNADFVAALKSIGAQWNREEKVWYAPAEKRADVEQLIKTHYTEAPDTSTLKGRVDAALADERVMYGPDTLDRLIAFAYLYGRESATKEVSDKYRDAFREIRAKAEKSRYHLHISEILGEKDYLPLDEYFGKVTKNYGPMKTDL